MSQTEPAGGEPAAANPGLAALPAIWVGIVVVMSIWGLSRAAIGGYVDELPKSITYFLYAGYVADIVNIVWGLVLVGLAVGRSPGFPRQFVIWQVTNIAWVVLRTAYVLINPEFVLSA